MSKSVDDYINDENPTVGEKTGLNQEVKRNSNGTFAPGQSGNKYGRKVKGETIVDKFRDNPKGADVIQNIIEIASTLGNGKNQHKDALSCAKLVVERLIPTLKSSDLNLTSDDDTGFIVLPEQKETPREDE